MNNSIKDVTEYVKEENVKFVRLAFCDAEGNLKNCAINADCLEDAFNHGVSFDGSALKGFLPPEKSDLLLFPDPSTLTQLPWRPSQGKAVMMFCNVCYPDKTPFEKDSRRVLVKAIEYAKSKGITCNFGAEFEFYLFKLDENGDKTNVPIDDGGYMSADPFDKGENIRRDICQTIREMGLHTERSHHEEGPGQNEIDFKYSDALNSADQAILFKTACRNVAYKNGCRASFDPKPLPDKSGSGVHVNVSVRSEDGKDVLDYFADGVLARAKEMTAVFNPSERSYKRLGERKAPKRIFKSVSDRTALIRMPASDGERRMELRSPDGYANVYLTYALIIYAGVDGVLNRTEYTATDELLPETKEEAEKIYSTSAFIKKYLGEDYG